MAIAAACPTAHVRGDRGDHKHQEQGEQHFQQHRLQEGAGGDGGSQIRDVAEEGEEGGAGGAGSQQLGEDVGRHESPRKVAGQGERHGDGRIDVGAGDVAYGVDRGHHGQDEGEADPQGAYASAGNIVYHDRPRPGEDQQEGAYELGEAAPQLVGSVFVCAGCRTPADNAQRIISPAGPRDRQPSK